MKKFRIDVEAVRKDSESTASHRKNLPTASQKAAMKKKRAKAIRKPSRHIARKAA